MGLGKALLLFFVVTTGFVVWLTKFGPLKKDLEGVPIISAPAGKIQGLREFTRDKKEIYSYKGIPFAKPPIGSLRFKRSEPLDEPFEGVFQATSNGNVCVQPFKPTGGFIGSEDCLVLSIYVPKTNGNEKVSNLQNTKILSKDFLLFSFQ